MISVIPIALLFGFCVGGAYLLGVRHGIRDRAPAEPPPPVPADIAAAFDVELDTIARFADPWSEREGRYSPTLTRFIWAIQRKEHRK